MKNKVMSIYFNNNHKIVSILGIKIKFKLKNAILNNGENNHVYIVDENGLKKEIFLNPDGLKITILGSDNTIILNKPFGRFEKSTIVISKSKSTLCEIDKNVYLIGTKINVYNGEKQSCYIGQRTSTSWGNVINIHNNSSLHIGKNCMFSQNVTIFTSDGHSIIDSKTKQILNNPKQNIVNIGDHCWLGFDTTILKNSKLPNDSILGAKSLLSNDFSHSQSGIYAGIPAKLIKSGVTWNRQAPMDYNNFNAGEVL